MNLAIENISSTSQQLQRSLYEVIHDDYFKSVRLFPTEFKTNVKNQNEPQNIPNEFKSALKKMALENGLYAQVVMIRRTELDDKKEKDKTKKYYFQGKSARTKHWFDLDRDCLKKIS